MFGIGLGELIVIAIAIFVFIKPEELPGFFRKIGRAWGELRSLNDKVKDASRQLRVDARDKEERK